MTTKSAEPAVSGKASRAQRIEALRSAYRADLAQGTDRFFEPRRTDCPWCGATSLKSRLRTADLIQHKPGRFTLDQCRGCGHVFQNPRLSDAGLEFYYRDFYDGLGEERAAATFRGRARAYRGRAQPVVALGVTPENWLDVGTGHGHFCATARELLPATRFDGLDQSEGAELAEREGRLDRGFRGLFPELAPVLAGQYDVVSMFHYLEHSTEPRRELDAARQALRPGGLLLIEVPDPQSRYAGVLGRWWLPWLQPQHLNLMPVANLRALLSELGFTVVAEQHGEPHDPVDLLAACFLAMDAIAPREDAPWLPGRPPGRVARVLRTAMFLAAAPFMLIATAADRLIARVAGRAGLSNAYRLLARYEE
ncbi:class I SAM-dependent methyltransferase [Actinospica sp.]|uniref:class I SAM-dependent methyltransferase n=1 Tax=Actinospica sp. TaxID=1872142 RepID=UPI002CD7A198|nr:class I SAM-dependent methyltransferase [Actinospica sp.]HWG27555.1 class I SAM-dependent methyltransferase [Actinospica sp.]